MLESLSIDLYFREYNAEAIRICLIPNRFASRSTTAAHTGRYPIERI